MNPPLSGLQFVVLSPGVYSDARADRRSRVFAHAYRARASAARIRLYSQAAIAKGRVLRAHAVQDLAACNKIGLTS